MSHLNGAHNRAGFAQGEFKVQILANLEGSLNQELKSFFGHIDDLAGNRLRIAPDLTGSIDRHSEEFSLLGH